MQSRTQALAIVLTVFATLCPPGSATAAEDAPGPVTLAMANGVLSDVSAQMLDRIVHPIVTHVDHGDGSRQVSVGSGFVVGQRFYTVNHNIGAGPGARRTILIEGVEVSPAFADTDHDLAVFILPDELCARLCNLLRFGSMPALERNRPVFWLRKFQGEHVYKRGQVLSYAVLGHSRSSASSEWSCDDNLVVEVDAPFVPGTSGSPVVHVSTGQIVGIVQGSLESAGVRTGYFLPVDCVRHLTRGLSDGIF